MDIRIRKETQKDYEMSEFITGEAFKNEEHSNHNEKEAVAKLRRSDEFVPELTLVAEFEGKIVGFIMYTKLYIKNNEKEDVSLFLSPISILPEYQNKGIARKLIFESFKIAREFGYKSVIVVGHESFYSKFGFKPASIWGIKAPFEIPDESFRAFELEEKSLENISGIVTFAKEFFE